jgi:hypothetical protein
VDKAEEEEAEVVNKERMAIKRIMEEHMLWSTCYPLF